MSFFPFFWLVNIVLVLTSLTWYRFRLDGAMSVCDIRIDFVLVIRGKAKSTVDPRAGTTLSFAVCYFFPCVFLGKNDLFHAICEHFLNANKFVTKTDLVFYLKIQWNVEQTAKIPEFADRSRCVKFTVWKLDCNLQAIWCILSRNLIEMGIDYPSCWFPLNPITWLIWSVRLITFNHSFESNEISAWWLAVNLPFDTGNNRTGLLHYKNMESSIIYLSRSY